MVGTVCVDSAKLGAARHACGRIVRPWNVRMRTRWWSINFGHRTGEPVRAAFDPDFDAIVERAEPVLLGDVEVPVVRRSDLIVMKERAGADPSRRRSEALRDLADVELLRGDVPEDDEGW